MVIKFIVLLVLFQFCIISLVSCIRIRPPVYLSINSDNFHFILNSLLNQLSEFSFFLDLHHMKPSMFSLFI